ncbi:TetR/AcrR family transcriptional regulator [Demequina litorisediminis]|uniref:TetR/AcrR family transcriptional regulator n=1 Tax=Demequina litorisediminis TaxID=1849022 RepID=UPI0024E0D10C|nr:helix-turn-helix domain-containing protein [Demequina litorisediminis]
METAPHGADARGARAPRRRRASHSLEAVVAASVAILDESGEDALTFRALAARLGGGVGSIYWYVSSKDEAHGSRCRSGAGGSPAPHRRCRSRER